MLGLEVPTGLEDVEVAGQVGLGVDLRVVHRVANPGLRRQMDDALEVVLLEQCKQPVPVDNVQLVEAEIRQPAQLGQACLLEFDAVVVVEVVDADYLVSLGTQPAGGVEADEAGGAGDQKPHAASSTRLPRPMP
ncbi:hypothetical protein D3C78_1295120 [compost metagenome]